MTARASKAGPPALVPIWETCNKHWDKAIATKDVEELRRIWPVAWQSLWYPANGDDMGLRLTVEWRTIVLHWRRRPHSLARHVAGPVHRKLQLLLDTEWDWAEREMRYMFDVPPYAEAWGHQPDEKFGVRKTSVWCEICSKFHTYGGREDPWTLGEPISNKSPECGIGSVTFPENYNDLLHTFTTVYAGVFPHDVPHDHRHYSLGCRCKDCIDGREFEMDTKRMRGRRP